MATNDIWQVLDVDASLDALENPTSSDVYWATQQQGARYIAAAAAARALSRPDRRATALSASLGWGGFTGNPSTASDTSEPTAGNLRGTCIQFLAGDTVTGLGFICAAAATNPTLCRLGLYTSDGYALLASTASDTALVGSAGIKTKDLSAPYTFDEDTLGYVAIVSVGDSFGSLVTCISDSSAHGGRAGFPPSAIRQQSLTDLPNPAVPEVGGFGSTPWVGWY